MYGMLYGLYIWIRDVQLLNLRTTLSRVGCKRWKRGAKPVTIKYNVHTLYQRLPRDRVTRFEQLLFDGCARYVLLPASILLPTFS